MEMLEWIVLRSLPSGEILNGAPHKEENTRPAPLLRCCNSDIMRGSPFNLDSQLARLRAVVF